MSWGGDSNAGYTPSHQVNNGGLPQTATTSKFNAFIKGYTSWEKDWLLATIAAVVLVPVVLFGAVVGGAEVGIPIAIAAIISQIGGSGGVTLAAVSEFLANPTVTLPALLPALAGGPQAEAVTVTLTGVNAAALLQAQMFIDNNFNAFIQFFQTLNGGGNNTSNGNEFANDELLERHYEDHKDLLNVSSKEEYLQKANNFINQESGLIKIGNRFNGDIVKVNIVTREIAIVTENGIIRTYYIIDSQFNPLDYFYTQLGR